MKLEFHWLQDDPPGNRWKELFDITWPAYRRWYLREGDDARPGLDACRAALERHMPELVPEWERRVALAGEDDDDLVARMLSLHCPPPIFAGCTQAVFTGEPIALVRNYDFRPGWCEATFVHTRWDETSVIGSSDCLLGLLDGMNDRGLATALAFGGRPNVGEGFGISLIVRYLLETCGCVAEAIAVLSRVPCHMSYNVSLADDRGERAVVEIAPDRPVRVVGSSIATNHQAGRVEWPKYEKLSKSVKRSDFLEEMFDDPEHTLEDVISAFLTSPIHRTRYDEACGTIYTVVYSPEERRVSYVWPRERVEQSLEDFVERTLEIDLRAGA